MFFAHIYIYPRVKISFYIMVELGHGWTTKTHFLGGMVILPLPVDIPIWNPADVGMTRGPGPKTLTMAQSWFIVEPQGQD